MPHRTQERREGEAATAKSRSRQSEAHRLADLPPLARGSLYLGLVMALGGPSCLLTQNPQFDGPQGIGPFVRVTKPYQNSVLAVGVSQRSPLAYASKEVVFDVYSEDLDQPLYAALYIDSDVRAVAGVRIPPGHLGAGTDGGLSQARPTVRFPFTIPSGTARGCHALTLYVTHDVDILVGGRDLTNDLAQVSWIVDVDDDPPNNLLSGCPQSP